MNTARLFSIWLIPEQDEEKELQSAIEKLAEQYEAPIFLPHMTLLGARGERCDGLLEALALFAKETTPLSLKVTGIGHEDNFFKTFYYQLKLTNKLSAHATQLKERLKPFLDPEKDYQLNPHLSLLYKQTTRQQRHLISQDFTQWEKRPKTIQFSSIALVYPPDTQNGWHDVAHWETSWRAPLSK